MVVEIEVLRRCLTSAKAFNHRCVWRVVTCIQLRAREMIFDLLNATLCDFRRRYRHSSAGAPCLKTTHAAVDERRVAFGANNCAAGLFAASEVVLLVVLRDGSFP